MRICKCGRAISPISLDDYCPTCTLMEMRQRIADLEAELATSCRANAMLSETIQELRSDLALTVGQLQERAEWDEAHKRAADWEEGISA